MQFGAPLYRRVANLAQNPEQHVIACNTGQFYLDQMCGADFLPRRASLFSFLPMFAGERCQDQSFGRGTWHPQTHTSNTLSRRYPNLAKNLFLGASIWRLSVFCYVLEEIVSCSEVSSIYNYYNVIFYEFWLWNNHATSKPLITNSFSRVCRTYDVADMLSMIFTSDVSKLPPVVEGWLGCCNA